MNWLSKLLGLNDRKQAQRTEEVGEFVHAKKNEFVTEMLRIQKQARKLHEKTIQAHEESVKLKQVVDDVASKIAVATGGFK